MNKNREFILGVRELPKPKGEGYLYYKLIDDGEEHFLNYISLYDLSDEHFTDIVRGVIGEVYSNHDGEDSRAMECVGFENLESWAQKIIKEVIQARA